MSLDEILDGVAATVAVPPEIDNAKSPTSNAPDPPSVLNTASLKVTDIVALSLAMVVPVIVGAVLLNVTLPDPLVTAVPALEDKSLKAIL